MTKEVATPKQTAGGGFAFEDKVVGYYLVWMLAGTSPLRAGGYIERIDCQVAADGWRGFDDLLITVNDDERVLRHALSLKSNLQFTKDSAPTALVRAAWDLLLHRSSGVMDIEADSFGLVCVPYPEPPKLSIQGLLVKARRQTPSQLAQRLPISGYASEVERSIHKSCFCPEDIASGLEDDDKLAGHILKRMSVIELDFEDTNTSSEATARFVCAELVESGKTTDANNLWNGLCQIAQGVRTAGGGIARTELLQEIRGIAKLRDLPDYARDWERLSTWRDTEINAIPDRVAGSISLSRDDVVAETMNALTSSHFVAAVGASGTGKSVVAKAVAEDFGTGGNVLWFRGERMRPGYIEALAGHHQLNHTLHEVLSNGKRDRGLIVLDSSERLLGESDFAEMCLLLTMLAMHDAGCSWRLLVTCREEAWERIQHGLGRAFADPMVWNPVRVDYPNYEMLSPVWDAFPPLRALAVRPHLSQVMRNLKVLDLLASATAVGESPDAGSWVGESQLITWYWRHVVRDGDKGTRRDILLQKLAGQNADKGHFETPEADLSPDELDIVRESSHLLSTDHDRGMVGFTHDLIADWARLRALLAHEKDLGTFCEQRFTNPHWHTALRLYGLWLLEADASGNRWRAAIEAHPDGRDSFLEALVFAGNLRGLLDGIWSILVGDKGKLLNAFLKRFQYVASIPNPEKVALAIQIGGEANEARLWERLPLWMYWIGVLPGLAAHEQDLLGFSLIETARLTRTWLRHTPRNWPGRQHAAALAIAVTRQALRIGFYSHRSEESGRLPYTALLEAYSDQPDAVREVLLKAAARTEPTEEDGDLFSHYEAPGTVTLVQSLFGGGERVARPPWPDGPLFHVDESFRAACFETDALRNVMAEAPDLAQEIILALLIEPQPPEMDHDFCSRGSMLPEDEVCLVHDHSFYPRFYIRGPFLLFLRVNPRAALHTIIRLIDFATERWMGFRYEEGDRKAGVDILVEGENKLFFGDSDVFHWHHGVSRSEIAASALMAVEKWIYDCLDRDEEVDQWVTLILDSSHSMAFLGMLCEVGRYAPHLLVGTLRPLLLSPEAYYLETLYAAQGGLQFGTPASLSEGEWFFNMAREWDSMEHRKRRLIDIAAYLFHRHKETREALLAARAQWRGRLGQGNERWIRHTNNLIASFDEENWKEVELPDGSKGLAFEEPEHLKVPPEQIERSDKQMQLLTVPIACRKMIDEGQRLEEDQLPSFVQQAKDLVGFEVEDEDAAHITSVANSLLGTAAVLFLLHRDWLRANPEEQNWCIETLDQILMEPPSWPQFDIPESVGNYYWEHFACEIAPVVWAEDPMGQDARARVVHLAFAKHYSAAAILMARAFERRKALGDEFWQFVNLCLEWSAMRWELRTAEYSGEQPDLTEWSSTITQRFLAGEIATDMPPWGERSLEQGRLWSAHNRHPRYLGKGNLHLLARAPKIDSQQIQALFSTVFLPEQARDSSERTRFLAFWDQALLMCLAGACFYNEDGNEIPSHLTEAGLPFDSDRWILQRLAVVVGQMCPEEKPERFWEPILALGGRAEHWVEQFLDHWFMDAKQSMEPSAFLREWMRMMDYCITSGAWATQGGRASFHMPRLWMCLVGLPRFTTSLWQDTDADLIESVGEYYGEICPHVLSSARSTVHFLSWLTETSARSIRRRLLAPIAEVGLSASEYWWKERHLARSMAHYLGLLWDEHVAFFEQNAEQRNTFLALMHRTAQTQEPLAMELQSRMASRQ